MRVDESRLTATYLLASRKHGTLYLGSALDLIQRVHDHREGVASTFTAKYGVTRLVWYEQFMLATEARNREYEMKKWRRDWKTNLIERDNPGWDDLYPRLAGAYQHPFPDSRSEVRDP
jgi:putative endonuclease